MFRVSLIGNAALALFEAMLMIFAGLCSNRGWSKYGSRPASGARLRHPLPQADDAAAAPNSVPRNFARGPALGFCVFTLNLAYSRRIPRAPTRFFDVRSEAETGGPACAGMTPENLTPSPR
jgi:hypothetical protein